jgi:hypothetical protein
MWTESNLGRQYMLCEITRRVPVINVTQERNDIKALWKQCIKAAKKQCYFELWITLATEKNLWFLRHPITIETT